ncbi:homocysteine S-methyltransferase family protein [Ahrensia sp. R2A130]|uniref:homocysteine S-methyltransferase family protein n=1 Tax=Ahrensia sp. R2A130 TaxID=744979 RepID=UPI0001E09C49|nr:homocysteine S-methyltransferase family protein [Ahrensia sp. R2A130]EFL89627.1 homocysteine S-methyltransferase [Ahrensia sp. R2A130]
MTNIVLLDGGMGQELIARSANPPSPLWSARVMLDEPEIVEAVHREYIEAGAKVLTLNSYSATPERLARDADASLFEPLQAKAIELAMAAKGDHDDVKIGGCLPPLFGSYHPENAPDEGTCLATYRQIVAQQKDHVDVFICETLGGIRETRAAVRACAEAGVPVWCGMTAMDANGSLLRSGESVEEAAHIAKEEGAAAVAINCSWPEAVTQAMPILVATGLPFGGWANGFTNAGADLALGGTVDGMGKRTDLDPVSYASHAMGWVEQGATIIGGCCEVGPAHIAELAKQLRAAGHTISGDL